MADELLMEEEPISEDTGVQATVKQFSVEDIPELSDLAVGDTLTFRVSSVSEDGQMFDVEVMADEETPEEDIALEEDVPVEEPTGREAITQALL